MIDPNLAKIIYFATSLHRAIFAYYEDSDQLECTWGFGGPGLCNSLCLVTSIYKHVAFVWH